MSIFGVLLAIFGTAVTDFSHATVRTFLTSDQTTAARDAFEDFDRTVPSATALNRPVLVGTNWYVEYETDSVTPNTCTQWVLRTATDTLAYRTWNTGSTLTTVPVFHTVATDVVNTVTQPPFAFGPSTTLVPLQRLTLNLSFQQGNGPVTVVNSTFAARNTSTSTKTNPDNNNDGVSDQQVCLTDFSGARP